MSIKIEKTENKNEVKLEFTVDAKIFENGIVSVFKKNSKYFNVPGFRKGKVPMNIAEKYYGVEMFYEDAFNEVVPEVYDEELKKNNIEAVSRPEIDIKQMEKGKDLIFTAVVQTKPEVKPGKYTEIELKKVEYRVTEKDIKAELEKMADKNSRMVTVENRAAKEKDTVVIDFEGFVDGTPFEGGKAENHEIVIGSKTFIEGFEDQLVGMKTGDEKEINVKFPEEYFSKDLAGKDAMFKVKLHEIKVKELPEMDDEFAKDVSEFETLDELKADIRAKLKEANSEKAKKEMEDAAIQKVCENTEVDIPSGMIESEIDAMSEDLNRRLAYQGMNLEQYLKLLNKSAKDFREELKPEAEKSVKVRLVLDAVCEDAKIKATAKEVNSKIKELAEAYGKKEEELKENEEFKKYVESSIKSEKTVKYIIDNAKVK
ncbi:MAG: trigger factor [Clostridia bacterium]|nr:trigger factor [Clostridia bacterium]